MHRVRNVAREGRPKRLATPTVDDNRISFGCVNIPVPFYEKVLRPWFGEQTGVVYVLPESQPRESVFPFLRALDSASADASPASGTVSAR
jgi:hypothetical protein